MMVKVRFLVLIGMPWLNVINILFACGIHLCTCNYNDVKVGRHAVSTIVYSPHCIYVIDIYDNVNYGVLLETLWDKL